MRKNLTLSFFLVLCAVTLAPLSVRALTADECNAQGGRIRPVTFHFLNGDEETRDTCVMAGDDNFCGAGFEPDGGFTCRQMAAQEQEKWPFSTEGRGQCVAACSAKNPPQSCERLSDSSAPDGWSYFCTNSETPDRASQGDVPIETFRNFFSWERLVGQFVGPFTEVILQIAAVIAAAAGKLLNFSIEITVNRFAEFVGGTSGINIAWRLIRDAMTIALSFVVLYAAFGLVFHTGGPGKKVVTGVLIIGFLMNFSLFFAKFGIDISNILARELFNPIEQISKIPGATDLEGNADNGFSRSGLAGVFVKAMKLTTIRSATGVEPADHMQMAIVNVMGAIFLLIAAFVFGAGAVLFIQVFVVRLILLATSVVMFFGFLYLGGGHGGYDKDWWKAYWDALVFPPIYLLLSLVSILMLFDERFQSMSAGEQFPKTFLGGEIAIVFNFVIAISFMIMALMVAKKTATGSGAVVSKHVGKWVGAATLGGAAVLGRQTLGRFGRDAVSNEDLKAAAQKGGIKGSLAKMTLKAGDRWQKASFDVRGTKSFGLLEKESGVSFGGAQKDGYAKRRDDKAKEKQKFIETTIPKVTAETREKLEEARQKLQKAQKAPDLAESEQRVKERQAEIENIKRQAVELDSREQAINASIAEAAEEERTTTGFEQRIAITKRRRAEEMLRSVQAEKAQAQAAIPEIERQIENESYSALKKAEADVKTYEVKAKQEEKNKSGQKEYAEKILQKKWWRRTGSSVQAAQNITKGKELQSDDQKLLELIKKVTKEEQKKQEGGGNQQQEGGGDKPKPGGGGPEKTS